MLTKELQKSALSVSAVAFFISNLLKNQLGSLMIRGEISGLRQGARGSYLYYSLVDDKSKIDCLTHSSSNGAKILQHLQDGDEIIVLARPNFYAAGGKLSFFTDEIMKLGEGLFASTYEKLKQQLYEEGLFKEEHKKALPLFPEKIGVVTSAEGAVLQDIIRVANDRWPLARILVFPALVQGESAPESLRKALTQALIHPLDALIIGRGGGSPEELSAFNDEELARIIFSAEIPVISAVGHEADISLCDYVSDYSAPTPTGAAMKLFPDRRELSTEIKLLSSHLHKNFARHIKDELHTVGMISRDIRDSWHHRLQNWNNINAQLKSKINAMNPESILAKGYALLLDEDGHRSSQFREGQALNVLTARHKLEVSINKTEKRTWNS